LAILLVLLLLIAGSKLLAARRKVEGQVLSGQEGSVGVKHDTSEE
jgi:hypothetical protein